MEISFNKDERQEMLETLVNNIPVLRSKMGITQQELADRIGITRNTLNAIENKKTPLTWVNFIAITLLFYVNDDTKPLLDALNGYSKKLDDFIKFV